ncbi:sugar phosphate nucleotidyltransferase [Ulvibacter antarcticus]|uniref:Glucose-1-phosphate adenylyltransferase n=1 Tax=Ulvibacter antarcticus TaxID=442714 RepID=A0A3L9YIS9_9FLAO|nr:sugar phosphate nucleotidyltransferase [Ulvibacter antarcticus]RMA58055.1 glucose-1-phosphate adenylyltransferase [Ulvibacter antarcticus]
MHKNLIILAAGASSRMKNSVATSSLSEAEKKQANSKSKAMIGIGKDNRPMIDYVLYNAEKAGYRSVYIVIGEDAKEFKEYFETPTPTKNFNKLNIYFATQYIPKDRTKPWGTADAIYQTLNQFPQLHKEKFTVCNGDNLYSIMALKTIRECNHRNALICYDRDGLQFSEDRIAQFALVVTDESNYLKDIIEKPNSNELNAFKDPFGKLRVSMNLFKLDALEIFPYLESCPIHEIRNEKELPTAILSLCKDIPNAVKGIPLSEHVPDLTAKGDILTLNEFLKINFNFKF